MLVNDLSVPTRFFIHCVGDVMFAKSGNIVIEANVPGAIVDYVQDGCYCLCTIAEGLLVIHKKVS